MKLVPEGLATGIGSMPHLDEQAGIRLMLKNFPQIPVWPQLPQKNFYEDMRVQFSESLPGIVCEPARQKLYVDTGRNLDENLENFYSQYLSGNLEHFAVSKLYAAGFYGFIRILKEVPVKTIVYIKGQVIGPVSMGLATTDQNKRSIIYREEFVDVLTKHILMKAKWQIKRLKDVFPEVIIFIDEPYLASFGSAYINLDKDLVVNSLREIVTAIKGAGALAGIHCCGNTDWSIPLNTDLDILSFDAFEFAENLALYSDKIKGFLNRDGILAWGIVPSHETDSEVLKIELLLKKLESGFNLLVKKGIDLEILKKSCLLTPSCGTGSLKLEAAEKVLEATRLLSEKIRGNN